MNFCLEAERFVDEKLSNWYVRRNRNRFQSSEASTDKVAAFQTLYTVLTTLAQLIAPVVPFLAEAMWQNLRFATDRESVHLCDYPTANEALIDSELSADMEALLRLVSLGGAARNAGKVAKIRQPLAELKVQPGSDDDQRAVERFADEFREELNIKRVSLHEPRNGPLLRAEVRLNMKSAGAKFGQHINHVRSVVTGLDPERLSKHFREIGPMEVEGVPVPLEAGDVLFDYKAPESWAGVADRGTQVMIDTRITPELAREGKARDIVRHVQDLRKKANLEMEDRIALFLTTDTRELREAIEAHRDHIAAETLTTQWLTQPPAGGESAIVKIDGQALTIALKRA
jgi:isoleucyl-tRNA synthetase